MLLVTATVRPPDATHQEIKLDYHIDAGGIQFAEAADHHRQAILDCMAVAYNSKGDDVAHIANTLSIMLTADEYAAILHDGIPVHQELTVSAGNYTIRIGALDRWSQRVGTVDAPIIVEAKKTAQN
jgi:hypothetical protein